MGNRVRCTHYDLNNNQVFHPESGCASYTAEYGGHGYPILYTKYDADGNLMTASSGYSAYDEIEYNRYGDIIDSYFELPVVAKEPFEQSEAAIKGIHQNDRILKWGEWCVFDYSNYEDVDMMKFYDEVNDIVNADKTVVWCRKIGNNYEVMSAQLESRKNEIYLNIGNDNVIPFDEMDIIKSYYEQYTEKH